MFRGVATIESTPGRTVAGALWWLGKDDVCALDHYEGAPSHYRQRIVEVETDAGPVEAMTYVMTHDTYVGLPSPWYLDRIAAGFRDWELPVETLRSPWRRRRRSSIAWASSVSTRMGENGCGPSSTKLAPERPGGEGLAAPDRPRGGPGGIASAARPEPPWLQSNAPTGGMTSRATTHEHPQHEAWRG